jgi:hypothetical protein
MYLKPDVSWSSGYKTRSRGPKKEPANNTKTSTRIPKFGTRLLVFSEPNLRDVVLRGTTYRFFDLVAVLAIVPTAYGCVHLAALHLVFPASIERIL